VGGVFKSGMLMWTGGIDVRTLVMKLLAKWLLGKWVK
jgi:hypothetical protein